MTLRISLSPELHQELILAASECRDETTPITAEQFASQCVEVVLAGRRSDRIIAKRDAERAEAQQDLF